MSRIRSQLDTILAGNSARQPVQAAPPQAAMPRRAYEPAASPQTRQQQSSGPSRDLASLQQSLEQLSNRINSLPRHQPAQTGETANAALVGEIRNGYQQLSHEIAGIREAVNPHLDADLKRIADGIAMLQNSQGVHPDYVEQMQAELANLNSGINQLISTPPTQVDLSGVSGSIESGYSQIVNKLDEVLTQRGSELPSVEIPDYTGQFESIHQRLEEVTRAVVSMTVSPNGNADQHSLERIEARLASLSKTVDALSESAPDNTMNADDGMSVAAEIARLSEKLDNVGTMGEVGTNIFADVQGIADRLDTLQNEIGVLASGLDGPMQNAGETNGNQAAISHIDEIEQRLGELAAKLEQFSGQPGDNPNTGSQEILSTLRDLVARVESIEQIARQAEGGDEPDRFADLEQQLSKIAAQLGTVGAGQFGSAVDLAPITERLDHIEGQIASSRDIVIDIATEAAQKAAAAGGASTGDETAYASVLEELRLLREGQNSGDRNDGSSEQLNEITTTINAIASRLAEMETAAPVSPSAAPENQSPEPHPTESRPYIPAGSAEPVADTNDWQEPAAQAVEPAYAEVAEAPSLDMTMTDDTDGDAAMYPEPEVTHPAGAAEMESAETVETDDVPLAPGTGMPDLEELVRNATKRKMEKAPQTAEKADVDGDTSDLLAAARRAAQMASLEASNAAEKPAKKPSRVSALKKIKTPGFVSRKSLMMTAAVAAIAIGGFTIAPKFFGSAPSDTVSEESMTGEQLSAGSPGEEALEESGIENADGEAVESGDGVRIVDETASAENASPLLSSEPISEINSGSDVGEDDETVTASLESAEEPATTSAPAISADIPQDIGNEALRAAMASGDGDALFEAGRRYTDGDGVDRSLENAVIWYRKAAESGHVPAQYRLGNFYEKGHGVAADQPEAAKWYAKAAASGNALAMHNLAVLNAMGVITGEPDLSTAVGWFEKAADMGVKDSQVNLGILYTKGMGVGEDLEAAYKWFAIAARGGDSDAGKKRDTVAQAMRPEQLERARGAAELWKPAKLDNAANIAVVRDEWKSGLATKTKTMDQAELVRQTQILLTRAGFDAGAPDGQFGRKTRNAIIGFQKKMGMTADGKITPQLLEALSGTAI